MAHATRRLLLMTALIGSALTMLAGAAGAQYTTLCDPSGTNVCRTVVVTNNCTATLWVGTLGNTVPCTSAAQCPTSNSTCSLGSCTCAGDADCG